MGRKRLSEEQMIEQYGSVERYEKHLESMRKWYREHPDRNREYYLKNRVRERKRTLQYRNEHQEYYEKQKRRAHNKIHNDPVTREHNRIRTSSRILADRLGIDRTGRVLHHITTPIDRKNFIILPREDHLWLHWTFGGKNRDVDLEKVLQVLPMLHNVTFVIDGKITNVEDIK